MPGTAGVGEAGGRACAVAAKPRAEEGHLSAPFFLSSSSCHTAEHPHEGQPQTRTGTRMRSMRLRRVSGNPREAENPSPAGEQRHSEVCLHSAGERSRRQGRCLPAGPWVERCRHLDRFSCAGPISICCPISARASEPFPLSARCSLATSPLVRSWERPARERTRGRCGSRRLDRRGRERLS
jgi:hypothetical protein